MNIFRTFVALCRRTEALAITLLIGLCGSPCPVLGQSAEISECVYQKLQTESSNAAFQLSAIKALQCLDGDLGRFFDFAFYAQGTNNGSLCSRYDELNVGCQSWLKSARTEAVQFSKIARLIHQCLAPTSSIDLKLKRAGINSPATLVSALQSGLDKARKCQVGEENAEIKPGRAWSALCNDYVEAPLSFWTVNDEYYEPCKNAEGTRCSESEASLKRAKLLRGFSRVPSLTVKWQQIVASIMAVDSLIYGTTAEERASAAKALGQHGDYSPTVMYTLLHALDDASTDVQAEAALALRTQGNKSPLIVFSLASLLYDEHVTPHIKGNVALALREQASQWECVNADVSAAGLNSNWSKNELGEEIPPCQKIDLSSRSESAKEAGSYFGLTRLAPMLENACYLAENDPNGSILDQIDDPSQLADFDIARNLCYLDKKVAPSKLERVARVVLTNLLADDDDEVRVRALLALRRLGEPVNGDASIIHRIRAQFLQDPNFRVRQAAVYALAESAKSQQWLVSDLFNQLRIDASPSVRKSIIAALSSLTPLTTKAGNSVYQHYTNAIQLTNSVRDICDPNSVEYAKAFDLVLSLGPAEEPFFTNGMNTARDSRIDLECPEGQAAVYPRLFTSSPAIGQDAVALDISLSFDLSGRLNADIIRRYLEIIYKGQRVPYSLNSVETSGSGNLEHTIITLKPDAALVSGQVYKVQWLKGFHHEGKTEAEGLSYNRNFLFQTVALGVGDQIFDLMNSDPSYDVRMSAAEVFTRDQPKAVFDFLYPLIIDPNPEIAQRAGAFLSSGVLDLSFIAQLKADEQLSFLEEFCKKLMDYVDIYERDLKHKKVATYADFQFFPSLGQQFKLMQYIFDQPWLQPATKQAIVAELKLEDWFFGKMSKDFPQQTFTPYERIYYGSVRTLWKDLLNKHIIDPEKYKNIDYRLYEKMPLQSEKEP